MIAAAGFLFVVAWFTGTAYLVARVVASGLADKRAQRRGGGSRG